LADAVASNGPKIVPILKHCLAAEKREVAKVDLIDVFLRMQELGYHPIASDADAMAFLEQQVSSMKDPRWRKMANNMLQQIRVGQ